MPRRVVPVPYLKRRRLGQIQEVLVLSICFMTLLILFSFFYAEMYVNMIPMQSGKINPNVVWRYAQVKKLITPVIPQQGNVNLTGEEDSYALILKRMKLTRAKYPMTLTAPYIIENSQLCAGNIALLTIVHTSTDHFARRQRLRESYGNKRLFITTYRMRIVFLLGTTADKTLQDKIMAENNQYQDIVQGDFIDSYHNLTLKGVMSFRWISDHCFHAKFVLKIDDDVYVNVFRIMTHILPVYGIKQKQILCNVMWPSPILRGKTKWKVDTDLFRGMKYYPPYCSGFTVLMTTDTARVMYQAAQFSPFFWVDDVYLFGLLPAKGGIKHGKLNPNVTLQVKKCMEDFGTESPKLLSCSAPKDEDFYYYWGRTLGTLPSALKNTIDKNILDKYSKPPKNSTVKKDKKGK